MPACSTGASQRTPPTAVAVFVPPEMPGLLAWLARRLPTCRSDAEAAAAATAVRLVLGGLVAGGWDWVGASGGGTEERAFDCLTTAHASTCVIHTQPLIHAYAQACASALGNAACRHLRSSGSPAAADLVQWESKALSEGLPLPAAALADAAIVVVRALGGGCL